MPSAGAADGNNPKNNAKTTNARPLFRALKNERLSIFSIALSTRLFRHGDLFQDLVEHDALGVEMVENGLYLLF